MAVKWDAALRRQWEPLGHEPRNWTDACALAMHHGFRDWYQGDRKALIKRSSMGDRHAFITLACRDWPFDADKTELPRQLAWVHEGKSLDEQLSMTDASGQKPDDALVAG